MFCGSCLKVSHPPGWCLVAFSVLLFARSNFKGLGLGKICSEQDDMKKGRTMDLCFSFQSKNCLVPSSSHPRVQANIQFFSLSVSLSGLICDTIVSVLPIYYFSFPSTLFERNSLCFQSRLTATAPVNNNSQLQPHLSVDHSVFYMLLLI